MGIIEVGAPKRQLTLIQRWSHTFTIAAALLLFLLGLNLRQNALTATVPYVNNIVGIDAQYPANWLLDTTGNYVFRVRDMSRFGYKTNIQMSVRPVGGDADERNVADRLALERGQTLIDYNVQNSVPYSLTEANDSLAIFYSYVSRDASPFLQSVPYVVRGMDIISLQRGQAIVTTFRAEADVFEQEFPRFERFLASLAF